MCAKLKGMKITKFVHSCLLVETPERTAIIDPGQFSWESGLFKVDSLQRLDDIIITHEHADHMSLDFLQALTVRFPNASITTTPTAAAKLTNEGLKNIHTVSNGMVHLFAANHESTEPLGPPPQNTGVHYGNLTHPGDSHSFAETKEILALPVTAPWGTMVHAAELGIRLKPKIIIPIHDWHWNETARQNAYNGLETFFAKQGIRLIKITDGQTVEL